MTTSSFAERVFGSRAPAAVLLVRISVGWVFVSEGIQKFVYPGELAAGRFAKIGIPAPHLMGPFVGAVETICGALILAGLATRLAAIPLVIDMIVALVSTKVPMLLGRGFLGFAAPSPSKVGLAAMLHEARTDLAMLFGALFLLLVGAGPISADAVIASRRAIKTRTHPRPPR
jgi:uncharacterized membrane protein YphA (DoxX/SURF4 family)